MADLTVRQREVLEFIQRQQRETGLPPTSREIQTHFRFLSQTAAMNHLRALEKKGAIERSPGKARASIDPKLRWRPNFRAISLLGQIPAGMSVDAAESEESTLGVDLSAFGLETTAQVFALRVRGDSMIGAQIADGDMVILERRVPKNGDIVAALIDGEVTLKRYRTSRGKSFLKAENPAYPDLVPVVDLAIQGVMVGLLRRVGR
ncbi:MAG: transcriptional repressor LexA [Chthoniobacterales bacterium]